MRHSVLCALAIATLATSLGADQGKPSRSALAPGVFAITDVTVIPMTGDTTLREATVVVRDGRITEVGAARSVKVPLGFVAADQLNPQKSRVLLKLCLTRSLSPADLQEAFYRY